ncbi:hypothetical protein MW887_011051 [Aspergillus wentii]|nr:hypothetical protein MW887_011051 [Aspergillus wentii]
MNDTSVEVPIMLSPEHSSYEDIAKLNPFYEEYRAFWNTSSDTSTISSYSSSSSSSACSSHSAHSDIDPSFHPLEMSSSPSLHQIPPYGALYVPDRLHVPVHDGKQYQPSYEVHDECNVSQIATLEYEDSCKLPIEGPMESLEIDLFDLDLADESAQQAKKPHKKLFGEKGWLGCTSDLQDLPNDKSKQKIFKGLGKKIKQHVEELAGDMATKAYPNPFHHASRRPNIVPKSTVPISLDPPTQAKLYSDMEVMICVSTNKFLVQQYSEGRISEESIKKVTNFWGSKNRPQVIEFQFDQATQRQLILSNVRTLCFNGESSTNPILLNSNLHNWKAIVKEMSVRTFCAPDSVIRKHMHDIHKLLDMLGAPAVTFLAFEELQMRTLSLMKEQLKRSYLQQSGDSSLSSFKSIDDSKLS